MKGCQRNGNENESLERQRKWTRARETGALMRDRESRNHVYSYVLCRMRIITFTRLLILLVAYYRRHLCVTKKLYNNRLSLIVDQCAQNNGTPKIGTYTQHALHREELQIDDKKIETREELAERKQREQRDRRERANRKKSAQYNRRTVRENSQASRVTPKYILRTKI